MLKGGSNKWRWIDIDIATASRLLKRVPKLAGCEP